MTPSGIEPATFRFVAQYLNHCATISGLLAGVCRTHKIIRNPYKNTVKNLKKGEHSADEM
jgi:hypothetical protein